MSESLYLLTICLPLATILLVFGMRYFATTRQANARLAQEQAFRQIAEKAVAAQSETAAALSSIQTSLAEFRTRVASIEKILKEVE